MAQNRSVLLNKTGSQRPQFNSWVGKIHWRGDRLPIPIFLGFSCGSAGKEPTCSAGDLGSVPRLGRSHGEGKGYPLQCSGLENSMDCIVHEVPKSSRTQLSNFHLHFWTSLVAQTVKNLPATWETWLRSLGWEVPLEEGMAIHSDILAWRIPWTERSLAGYNPWGHKELDTTDT